MRSLTGQWVVVTGAGSGIGNAIAESFAAAGARLAVCDIDRECLAAAVARLGSAVAVARAVDVADRAAMLDFAREVELVAGRSVDVVVNNAGVVHCGGLTEFAPFDWDWILGVNLRGVIHGCEAFAPAMRAARRGHIFNIASVLGLYAAAGLLAYSTSKFAVVGFSQSLRAELRADAVHVTAVCPGLIATNIAQRARFAEGRAASRAQAIKTVERGAPPSAVATAILHQVGRPRAILPVPADARWIARLARIAPGTLDRVASYVLSRAGLQSR